MKANDWIKHIAALSSFNDHQAIIDGFNHLRTIFNDSSKVDEIVETLKKIRRADRHSNAHGNLNEIIQWFWSSPMHRATIQMRTE
jgi:hypothetical protein